MRSRKILREAMAERTVLFKIRRQDAPSSSPRWEEFELAWHPGMNVISSMMEIARNPITRDGNATTPITYDSNCLEEVCGSCAMLINGKARMACSALVDNLEKPIRLEPLSKFPVVRDLAVDRSVLFENLKRVKPGYRWTGPTISALVRASPCMNRRPLIRFRGASLAVVAWKSAHNSTSTPASSALRPFRRYACSTPIPRGRL